MPKNYDGYPKMMKSGERDTQDYHEKSYKDMVYSNSYAGMPEEKVMKEYSKMQYGLDSYYNDNIWGIDKFSEMNDKTIKKQINKPY